MLHSLPIALALIAALPLAAMSLAGISLPAAAQQAEPQAAAKFSGLVLSQGDIFTNDVGTVMGVSVVNETAATVGSVGVNCAFTVNGKPAGSAGTTIYNIVAGAKGQDQVHLMGPKADAATCTITSTTAPLN
ncbi:hypothetical protein KHC23_06910 [Ancylobacter dichloromethanicus]|uniref:Uncharacterized protein n=1 Tax=Ancylobacter dichloromethanicus TaxID=518825 RepID=A0A9W6JB53_9HYPH|nr:hypothetical protein [Ancylobacter dichloromethanicus]MBS7553374.1 hypothetical protein [Ancylobacter dichloromethanicus]GLK74295.1 hypothetical protein GCM10017643_44130 [Ancylobacter dichloromethanicus]